MRILDRYILKSFLIPFVYCFLGFIAIWLVFDLSDNGPDFIEGKVKFSKILGFYLTQLPDIMMICLPVGLLLALLYSLSKLSKSNEVISMLTAGVSLPRILFPLFIIGLLVTALMTLLNYEWAPHAQANKDTQLAEFKSGKERNATIQSHLFRNRTKNRTWYAEKIKLEENSLEDVQIIQQDEEGRVLYKYYVVETLYRPETNDWQLIKPLIVEFDLEGNVTNREYLLGEQFVNTWDETPQRIASGNFEAEMLSIPELQDYLEYNKDFPDSQLAPFRTHLLYRWALPWAGFIVVFIAAPLGIVYSRRGVLAGVASSIFIFFIMTILTNLFLALGVGARIPPFWAAWIPNLLFFIFGLTLLWFRAMNRDVSSLFSGFRKKSPPSPSLKRQTQNS